jgi:hypothetical protein
LPKGSKSNGNVAIVKIGDNGVLCMVYHSEIATFLMTSALTLHGSFTPTTLEAMAYREALALVHDLNIQRVCVATTWRSSRT